MHEARNTNKGWVFSSRAKKNAVELTFRSDITNHFEGSYVFVRSQIIFAHPPQLFQINDNYRPQTKFAKVMFSQVSVHRGACMDRGRAWQGGMRGGGGGHAWQESSHCSRQYASYWNAFLLVSTYAVCERLCVMHRQARLPEIFDQIAQNTPVPPP